MCSLSLFILLLLLIMGLILSIAHLYSRSLKPMLETRVSMNKTDSLVFWRINSSAFYGLSSLQMKPKRN